MNSSPEQSDVNVLIVFRAADIATLDRSAPFIRQSQLEFGLSAMLMTAADLADSADVSCLAFATTGDPFTSDPGCWLSNSGK